MAGTAMAEMMQGIGGLLTRISRRLEDPVGAVAAHLRSLGQLPPTIARIDMLEFQGTIDTSTVSAQPDVLKLNPEFYSEVFGMFGYVEDPATDFKQFAKVKFNIEESGADFKMFKNDISMASLISTSGAGPTREYPRGMYRFSAGADISLKFSTTATLAAAQLVGVVLLVNNFHRKVQ